MDIAIVLMALGYLDELENPCPNMSTYQTMVATWRHTVKTPPTEADMLVAWEKHEVEFAATQYIRDRKKAYPSIGDQLDMLWHSMNTGEINKSLVFYEQLLKVKNDIPKS